MARRRPYLFKLTLACLMVAVLLVLSRSLWLPLLGKPLIQDDGPAKADLAIVLAGDPYGNRILKAAELVRGGYVPKVLVSGPEYYGVSESDLAIAFAAAKGCPQSWFISFPNKALSTREEADAILPELHRQHIQRFLLVTSDYHSARAGRIFRDTARRMGNELEIRIVAAPDKFFHAETWWHTRQGQKTVFTEWWKTVATAMGM